MKPLRAAYCYFSVVFTIAFLLEPVYYLWLLPHFGRPGANWSEGALLLVATVVTARWVVLKLEHPASVWQRFGVGFISLGLILVSEITVEFWIRHLSLREFLAENNDASAAIRIFGLAIFTVMPLLMGGRKTIQQT